MLRGAIVGASYFAHHHMEAWRRIEGVEIVGVADIDPARVDAFRSQWRLPCAYPSLEALLDDGVPDFVDIVTRPEAHLPLARLAFARDTHVITQKPLAPTWEESVEMAALGGHRGRRLIVHDNWRWQPWYRWTRARIEAGTIGTPRHARVLVRLGDGRGPAPYARQPYFREMPRLLVYETLVHYLDTLTFLLGPIRDVWCRTSRWNPVIAGDDTAIVTLGFDSGATAVIDATRVSGPAQSPPAFGTCIVEGDEGTVAIDSDGTATVHRSGVDDRFVPDLTTGYRSDSVRAAQAHYAICLATGEPAETEVSAYLPIVWAVEACYASARTGQVYSAGSPLASCAGEPAAARPIAQ